MMGIYGYIMKMSTTQLKSLLKYKKIVSIETAWLYKIIVDII